MRTAKKRSWQKKCELSSPMDVRISFNINRSSSSSNPFAAQAQPIPRGGFRRRPPPIIPTTTSSTTSTAAAAAPESGCGDLGPSSSSRNALTLRCFMLLKLKGAVLVKLHHMNDEAEAMVGMPCMHA
eukprot:GEZU01009993.1.p1 GENE.GEZU01009993.1~~GEZU01009993.1.p1  ORF type:complete len:127 (-),score=24.67 GEZU01009993.1:316-696(-)